MNGCASIVEGTDQPIRVSLTPANANCVVTREGEQVASISRDNQSIRVGKSKNNLEFECRAPGHLTENLSVESSASGWGVVGCILIDLCITDYSTGALNKYPPQVTIALTPETFRSEQERDQWLQSRRHDIEAKWDRRIRELTTQCEGSENADACQNELSNLRDRKNAELARLDRQKAETRITATPASATGSINSSGASIESRLRTVNDLFSRGLISREEYERKRREIMSGI